MRLRLLLGRNGSSHEKVRELLSAHLDGRLSRLEGEELEGHLQGCLACSRELESLRAARMLMRGLPSVRLPRSFTLAEVEPRRISPSSLFFAFRNASAVAAAAFVALFAASAVLPSFPTTMEAPSRTSAAQQLSKSAAEPLPATAAARAAAPAAGFSQSQPLAAAAGLAQGGPEASAADVGEAATPGTAPVASGPKSAAPAPADPAAVATAPPARGAPAPLAAAPAAGAAAQTEGQNVQPSSTGAASDSLAPRAATQPNQTAAPAARPPDGSAQPQQPLSAAAPTSAGQQQTRPASPPTAWLEPARPAPAALALVGSDASGSRQEFAAPGSGTSPSQEGVLPSALRILSALAGAVAATLAGVSGVLWFNYRRRR